MTDQQQSIDPTPVRARMTVPDWGDASLDQCPHCEGTGLVNEIPGVRRGKGVLHRIDCPACLGTGVA